MRVALRDGTRIFFEVIDGSRPGRTNAEQVTVYKSVGVAVMDAAAAALVLKAAAGRGAGTEIDL